MRLSLSLLLTTGGVVTQAWTSRRGSTFRHPTLSVAVSSVETNPTTKEGDDDEAAFKLRCKGLCDERNLKLEKVKNARDLVSAVTADKPIIQPGRVFRMGRVSDATEEDISLLMDELDLRTLVDLRSPTELKDDPTLLRSAVFSNFTTVVWKEQGRKRDGCLKELKAGESPVEQKSWWKRRSMASTAKDVIDAALDDNVEKMEKALQEPDDEDDSDTDCEDCGDDALSAGYYTGQRKERHFVSLMNEFKYVKGTVSKVRKRDITKAILKSPGALLSRRVRSSVKKPFLDEINDGGLPMLNELLLRFGAPGIKYVLELCADKNRHPIAFYCTAGKDRTGMIAALLLALCGVKADDIVEDYTLSANVYAEMNDHQAMVGALSQRNLDPKTFLSAPPHVMRNTLLAIEQEYGSVEGYCDWIGFGPEQQQKLRDALTKPDA